MLVGLTGGAGAGKSTVASAFRKLGARVIDVDRIGHGLLKRGSPCFSPVVKAFGSSILRKGRIDRKSLGQIVFSDKKALVRLNRIVQPYILKKIKNEISEIKNEKFRGIIVIDAALLVQWSWHQKVDCVVVVAAPLQQRLQRLADKGRSLAEARRIIATQPEQRELLKAADYVIVNDQGLQELKQQVTDLERIIKHL